MADARDSNGGFLGSSTVQVRDSSPSGQTAETVEAILVPEGTVSFPRDATLDDDSVTVRNLQLVGDNLVLMEGGMIVSEDPGTILVQDSLYVQADHQLDGHTEHVIAYLPESVPDQGHSLESVDETEPKPGSRLFETEGEAESGMYDSGPSTVPTMDETAAEAMDVTDDGTVQEQQEPPDTETVLEEMTSCYGTGREFPRDALGGFETTADATDQSVAQEVPQRTVSPSPIVQSATIPESAESSPEEGGGLPMLDDDQPVADVAEEVPASVPDGEPAQEFVRHVDLASFEATANGPDEAARQGPDQELQVVPDSSACSESGKAPLSENLHETVETAVDEAEPSAGVHLVPTSFEDSSDVAVVTSLQDSPSSLSPNNEEESELISVRIDAQEESGPGDVGGDEVPDSSDGAVVAADTEVDGRHSSLEEETVVRADSMDVKEPTPEDNSRAILTLDDMEHSGLTGSSGIALQTMDISQLLDGGASKDVIHVLQKVQSAEQDVPSPPIVSEPSVAAVPEDGQRYELCVAMPDGQNLLSSLASSAAAATGTQTITVPVTIGDEVQQIPIQLPDWADLTQQNLVAVAEDGTTIPLTVIRTNDEPEEAVGGQTPDVKVEEEEEEEQQHLAGKILEQLSDSTVSGAMLSSDGKLLLATGEPVEVADGADQEGIAFINMLQSQESVLLSNGAEFPEGIIHLVQNPDGTQTAISGFQVHPAAATAAVTQAHLPRYIYGDATALSVQEQSILPDNPEELASVIHIPEEAYLSGQPIELQVVEVADNRAVRAATAVPAKTASGPRGRGRRGTPSAVTVQPRPPRQLTGRASRGHGRVTASESQRAIRSIGRGQSTSRRGARGASAAAAAAAAAITELKTEAPLTMPRLVEPSATFNGQEAPGPVLEESPSPQVELSNTTPSVISPENMQTLIQILQSLPNTSRGQTIQIILQNNPPATPSPDTLVQSAVSSAVGPDGAPKQQYVQVVRMPPAATKASKTTSDIAIQVSPEFIENAQAEAARIPSPVELPNDEMAAVAAEAEATATTMDVDGGEGDVSNQELLAQSGGEDDDPQLTAAILMGLGIDCGDAQGRKRRSSRKKSSKQIVTVEEQWVVDPKPGVSYYAVIDYLSEHEHDGFSSASEMKRPEAPSSGFMEDHLELHGASDEPKGRSMLESTVDSSVIVSPFRRGKYRSSAAAQTGPAIAADTSIDLPPAAADDDPSSSVTLQERTFEQAQLEEEALAEPMLSGTETKRPRRQRASRSPGERYEHRCGYCEFGSRDKILVVEHCMSEHPDDPVKTLSLLPQMGGRTCPYCHQSFDHSDFFSHMRFAHNEVHPYKCGYCDFMGRDRNQIRHHIQKKHRLPMKVINLMDSSRRHDEGGGGDPHGRRRIMALSEGEETVYEYLTDEEELDENDSDAGGARRGLICPECKKTFKTLKYLKTHIKIHQAHRYQCGYCDFISVMLHQVIRHCQRKHAELDPKVLTKELEPDKNPVVSRDIDTVVKKVFSLNTRLPRDPDASKWMRKWFCPHCDYTCQFGASYRRHLRMHANVLPFKCNYCSFKGREKYYVRRHIHRMHRDLPMIVVENTPENCAADTSSDEDFQEKGLRRKRRRRTKDMIHAVVPVVGMEDEEFGQQFQKLPVGERGMRCKRQQQPQSVDVENDPTMAKAATDEDGRKSGRSVPRLPRTKEWSGENISDYIQEKDGDKIVCKMCGQKTLAKAFYKHARKHFKIKPFKCGYCNYMSIERAKIRVHNTLKHPSAPFKIEECHLASITPQDFMDLIGVEGPNGPDDGGRIAAAELTPAVAIQFCCPLCQSTIDYDEKNLRDHFFAHYDYYPYKCSECDFRATSEDKVLEHSAVHDTPIIVYEIQLEKPEGLEETILQFLKEGQELLEQQQRLEAMPAVEVNGDDVQTVTEEESAGAVAVVASEKSPSSIFQCPICNRQMNLHAVTVRRHLYSHYNYKPFKCGYCNFQGVSKANIKQHTVTHGSVRPKIELTDELMPDDLTKMLRHLQGVLRLTPETVDHSAVVVDEMLLGGQREDPITAEGKLWKDTLAQGQCPWCDVAIGNVAAKLHAHLLTHFSPRPFQCGHCSERFAKRSEVNQHIVRVHKGMELRVVEVIEDKTSVRKGLLQYLRHKRSSVGARNLVENTTVDPTAAIVAAAKSMVEPSSQQQQQQQQLQAEATTTMGEGVATVQEAILKGVGVEDGKEYQYQVVILSEDGTLVESMEVVAERAADAIDGSVEVIGRAPLKVALEKVDATSSVERAGEAEPIVVEMANGQEASVVLPAATLDDQQTGAEHAENGSDVGKVQRQPRGDAHKDDDDTMDADIVTVEGVLLTRSFRSETEASDDGSVPSRGSAPSSDEDDDDDDEVLACGPSLEFVGDILGLLKQSSANTVTASRLQANLECELCHRRFLKSSGLQTHMTRVHKGSATAEVQCEHCGNAVKDRAALDKHYAEAHVELSTLATTATSGTDGSEDVSRKRSAESPTSAEVVSKKARLEDEPTATVETVREEQPAAVGEEENDDEEETVENIARLLAREGKQVAQLVVEGGSGGGKQDLVLVQEVVIGGADGEKVLAATRLQANVECEVCHRRFLKQAGLHAHMTKMHKGHVRREAGKGIAIDVAESEVVKLEDESAKTEEPDVSRNDDNDDDEETVENITKMLEREGKAATTAQLMLDGSGDQQSLVLVQEVLLCNADDEATLAAFDKGEIAIISAQSLDKDVVSQTCAETVDDTSSAAEPNVAAPSTSPTTAIPSEQDAQDSELTKAGAATTEGETTTLTSDVVILPSTSQDSTTATTGDTLSALRVESSVSVDGTQQPRPSSPPPPPQVPKKDAVKPKTPSKAAVDVKTTRVTRRTGPSAPQPVHIGKYQLRGRGRQEDGAPQTPSTSKHKSPKGSATSGMATAASPKGAAALPEPEVDPIPESAQTGASSSAEPTDPNTAASAEDAVLESLENLEECDENLPKILQILQLRPRKEADKV